MTVTNFSKVAIACLSCLMTSVLAQQQIYQVEEWSKLIIDGVEKSKDYLV